jgi:hypothetical protein
LNVIIVSFDGFESVCTSFPPRSLYPISSFGYCRLEATCVPVGNKRAILLDDHVYIVINTFICSLSHTFTVWSYEPVQMIFGTLLAYITGTDLEIIKLEIIIYHNRVL